VLQLKELQCHTTISSSVDGLALCRAIQTNPAYQAIPVIVMSAIIDPPAADGCHALGFLRKPFDLQNVVDMITNVIGVADHV
jgi:CheY-like chemotaxis protein